MCKFYKPKIVVWAIDLGFFKCWEGFWDLKEKPYKISKNKKIEKKRWTTVYKSLDWTQKQQIKKAKRN